MQEPTTDNDIRARLILTVLNGVRKMTGKEPLREDSRVWLHMHFPLKDAVDFLAAMGMDNGKIVQAIAGGCNAFDPNAPRVDLFPFVQGFQVGEDPLQ